MLAKTVVPKGVKILLSLPLVPIVALLVAIVAKRAVLEDVRIQPSRPVVRDVVTVVI